ncbi:hypothetical protein FNV43_RR05767 [Rhamnella rubrinervis]|uniref:Uncharacterized protein n=1 Tax=Rhamnella rubrinervis TaxID=2594499 RepID=A0A8K0HN90_9ROSA|nr:hypothetical protein FNV43_RR05767 [Rhamnella rubrinervis]
MWYQGGGYVPMAAHGDRRGRPIDEVHGLLIDDDREYYRVRRCARSNIPGRVLVDFIAGKDRPRPWRQLVTGVLPPKPLFTHPTLKNISDDFAVGVPNQTQQHDQRHTAGDVLRPVRASQPNFQRCGQEDFGINFSNSRYASEIGNFYDLDIPIFDGLCGMCDVTTWIKSVDKYFEYVYVDLAKQAKLVEFTMTAYASMWWRITQNARIRRVKFQILSWKKMRKEIVKTFLFGEECWLFECSAMKLAFGISEPNVNSCSEGNVSVAQVLIFEENLDAKSTPENCLKGYDAELTRVSLEVDSEKIEEPVAQTNQGVEEEIVEHLAFAGKDLFSLFHNHVLDDLDVDKHNSMLFVKMCNCEVLMDVHLRTFHACDDEFYNGMKKFIFKPMILSIWQTILLRIYSLGVYINHRKRGSSMIMLMSLIFQLLGKFPPFSMSDIHEYHPPDDVVDLQAHSRSSVLQEERIDVADMASTFAA